MAREKLVRHEDEKAQKHLKLAQEDLKKKERLHEKAAAEQEGFEADLRETEAKAEEFEREVAEEMAKVSSVPVTSADLREFERLERELAKRTATEQRALKDKARANTHFRPAFSSLLRHS